MQLNKSLLLILLLFSVKIYSQNKKDRNCKIPKNITLSTSKSDSGETYKVRFTRDTMKQVWGDNLIIITSKMKILNDCKFETEITKIESKLFLQDSTDFVGKKTAYEIIRSDKKEFIYTYWCNEGRNTCTEILERR